MYTCAIVIMIRVADLKDAVRVANIADTPKNPPLPAEHVQKKPSVQSLPSVQASKPAPVEPASQPSPAAAKSKSKSVDYPSAAPAAATPEKASLADILSIVNGAENVDNWNTAAEYLTFAIEMQPSAELYMRRARCSMRRDAWDKVKRDCTSALDLLQQSPNPAIACEVWLVVVVCGGDGGGLSVNLIQ